MLLIARLRALYSFSAALAIAQLLGCGTPGDPVTTEATSQASTDDPKTTDTSSDPTTADPGTSSDATTGAPTTGPDTLTTDPTTAGPGSCAELCERTLACTDQVPLEQCLAGCESADDGLRACLLGCDQDECQDLLHCTTVCAQPGDPDATPYDDCSDGSAGCLPGVYECVAAAYGGDPNEYSACAPFCDDEGNCPVPETGTATPICEVEATPSTCSLDCSNGEQCPDGMVCTMGGTCMWVKG